VTELAHRRALRFEKALCRSTRTSAPPPSGEVVVAKATAESSKGWRWVKTSRRGEKAWTGGQEVDCRRRLIGARELGESGSSVLRILGKKVTAESELGRTVRWRG
jgi:hypothetical protein